MQSEDPRISRTLVWAIVLGLLAWGSYLALGAYLGGAKLPNHFGRPLVVMGCVVAYIAFWLALLAHRKRRLHREAEQQFDDDSSPGDDDSWSEKNR